MFLFITHPTNICYTYLSYCVPSIVLDIEDVSVNKIDKNV